MVIGEGGMGVVYDAQPEERSAAIPPYAGTASWGTEATMSPDHGAHELF
jgi:hypothetical protein